MLELVARMRALVEHVGDAAYGGNRRSELTSEDRARLRGMLDLLSAMEERAASLGSACAGMDPASRDRVIDLLGRA